MYVSPIGTKCILWTQAGCTPIPRRMPSACCTVSEWEERRSDASRPDAIPSTQPSHKMHPFKIPISLRFRHLVSHETASTSKPFPHVDWLAKRQKRVSFLWNVCWILKKRKRVSLSLSRLQWRCSRPRFCRNEWSMATSMWSGSFGRMPSSNASVVDERIGPRSVHPRSLLFYPLAIESGVRF